MSDAFFCDRCGRAFPFKYKQQIISKGFRWKTGDDHNKDLCRDCVAELKEFLDEKKDDNKEENILKTGNDIRDL